MVRTVVSLDEDDKRWLDRRAAEEGLPMTELVRRAIKTMRAREGDGEFHDLLERTSGTWRNGDGLAYQEALRREWPSGAP